MGGEVRGYSVLGFGSSQRFENYFGFSFCPFLVVEIPRFLFCHPLYL